jgi:DNA uptake protein ComE-like DNA-binding protein
MLKHLTAIALALALGIGTAAAQTPTPATPPAAKSTAPAATKELLDINSASAKEMVEKLESIGDARAAAIVKGRPYKGKDELVQKNVIPEAVYAKIKDQIIAKQK